MMCITFIRVHILISVLLFSTPLFKIAVGLNLTVLLPFLINQPDTFEKRDFLIWPRNPHAGNVMLQVVVISNAFVVFSSLGNDFVLSCHQLSEASTWSSTLRRCCFVLFWSGLLGLLGYLHRELTTQTKTPSAGYIIKACNLSPKWFWSWSTVSTVI